MESEVVEDPIEFFGALGGLHDVRINGISLDIEEQILALMIDDLYWNFEGTPEYPGERPCALIFFGVSSLKFHGDIEEGLRIGELRVMEEVGPLKPYRLEVDLNIGGVTKAGKSITASFGSLEIENSEIT